MCLILLNSASWLGIGISMAIIITFIVLVSCSKEEVKLSLKYEFVQDILSNREIDFLGFLNKYRDSINLPILRADEHAGELAYWHNVDMIAKDEPSHDEIDRRRSELINAGALSYGEIIGFKYSTCLSAWKAFIASPEHLRVIKGNWNTVGIDIMEDYFTIIFIQI